MIKTSHSNGKGALTEPLRDLYLAMLQEAIMAVKHAPSALGDVQLIDPFVAGSSLPAKA